MTLFECAANHRTVVLEGHALDVLSPAVNLESCEWLNLNSAEARCDCHLVVEILAD